MKTVKLLLFKDLKKISTLVVFGYLILFAQQLFASYSFLNVDPALAAKSSVVNYLEKSVRKLPPSILARFEKQQVKINIKLNEKYKRANEGSTEYASIEQTAENVFTILLEPYFVYSTELANLENLTVKDWLIGRQNYYGRAELNKKLSIPKHKNASAMLESILIHEISHAYDMLHVPYMKYMKTRLHCIQAAAAGPFGGASVNYLAECKALTNISTSVSTLPEFMHAAGWPERGFLSRENQYINQSAEGSANYYEAGSVLESFAVNMEFYLLDPQFQCHRPNLYNFLKDYFNGYTPFPETRCQSTRKILISNTDFLFNKDETKPVYEFVDLDESKLYQIHYFYAGKNNEMMSKFGHGMLRLVFCAPERKTVGPECLKDTKHHIVASFAAFIGDVQINPLDGLFGGYAAHLFMSRLSDVLDTYNDTELRELYSLPLKLTAERKHKLLDAIYEAHWSYRGNYSFLSNNCAIETHSVIKTAFLDVPAIIDSYVVRPDSLFSLLPKLKIADGSVFDDNQYAFNYGYFYPSLRAHYETSLKILADHNIADRDMDLDEYIDLKPADRSQYIQKVLQIKDRNQRGIARLAARKLENLSLKKYYQDSLKDKLPEIIKKLQSKESTHGIDKDQVVSFIKKLSIPAETLDLKGSYGVPNAQLVEQDLKKVLSNLDRKSLSQLQEKVIKFVISCLDKEQIETLLDYDKNITALVQKNK